jgi:RNA-binding protein
MKTALNSYQCKYLRGLAHGLKPIVLIGQKGLSPSLIKALDEALTDHELVKVKFVEGKEKDNKNHVAAMLEKKADARLVGMIGHTAIFFRPHPEAGKRKIIIPASPTS